MRRRSFPAPPLDPWQFESAAGVQALACAGDSLRSSRLGVRHCRSKASRKGAKLAKLLARQLAIDPAFVRRGWTPAKLSPSEIAVFCSLNCPKPAPFAPNRAPILCRLFSAIRNCVRFSRPECGRRRTYPALKVLVTAIFPGEGNLRCGVEVPFGTLGGFGWQRSRSLTSIQRIPYQTKGRVPSDKESGESPRRPAFQNPPISLRHPPISLNLEL